MQHFSAFRKTGGGGDLVDNTGPYSHLATVPLTPTERFGSVYKIQGMGRGNCYSLFLAEHELRGQGTLVPATGILVPWRTGHPIDIKNEKTSNKKGRLIFARKTIILEAIPLKFV